MSKIFLFDVDGTLTTPRQAMDERFAEFFFGFCSANLVYLVSGSDYLKLCEQVPMAVLEKCRGVYGCSGATLHVKNREIFSRHHAFDPDLVDFCSRAVSQSSYVVRTGIHIEHRTGMINLSTVGRNANPMQREVYNKWDQVDGERARIVEAINRQFPDYEASAGGEISVDVVPKGWNKSVVMKYVLEEHPAGLIRFFGDRMLAGGNDLPLAEALNDGSGLHESISVSGYKDTWRLLEAGTDTDARLAA